MAQNWLQDPKTGDYVMSGGAPVQTDALTMPAYYRLKTKRTQWLYAPNEDFGSDLYLLRKRSSSDDASAIESIAAKALQPMADDGRVGEISVDTVSTARNGVGLQAKIVDVRGEVQTLNLPQV